MVKINKIYTKNGDRGQTQLVSGKLVSKADLRVMAYGEVDELNSCLGMALAINADQKKPLPQLQSCFEEIQQELFNLGAYLACPPPIPDYIALYVPGDTQVIRLEQEIDQLTEKLPELRSFILPGGSQLNASLHVARCVCRRAERSAVALHNVEPLEEVAIRYLNRLSDLLFALARAEAAFYERPEVLWKNKQV